MFCLNRKKNRGPQYYVYLSSGTEYTCKLTTRVNLFEEETGLA